VKRFLPVLVLGVAVLACLLSAEVGMRLFSPDFSLSYTEARFSARYHHGSPERAALLKRLETNPKAIKEDTSIVVLGDSIVADEKVAEPIRFTSVIRNGQQALRRNSRQRNRFGCEIEVGAPSEVGGGAAAAGAAGWGRHSRDPVSIKTAYR
jgi:hypothetical protein